MGACSTFSEDSLLSEIAVTRGITGMFLPLRYHGMLKGCLLYLELHKAVLFWSTILSFALSFMNLLMTCPAETNSAPSLSYVFLGLERKKISFYLDFHPNAVLFWSTI